MNSPPPNDYRGQLIARALCEAHGHAPDAPVIDLKAAQKGPFMSVKVTQKTTVPAWRLYLPLAQAILDAIDKVPK